MTLGELLQLKFPQASFLTDILLRDDGQGAYIKDWNLPIPKPSEADLARWEKELDLAYRQSVAVQQRKYPPISEQLDMLYNDKLNNTTTWIDTITAIKQTYPKPIK